MINSTSMSESRQSQRRSPTNAFMDKRIKLCDTCCERDPEESSTALSQNPNDKKISEFMKTLRVLLSMDIDFIMSTAGVLEEISSLVTVKDFNEIKDHLSHADFGAFSAIQMCVGRFESHFPHIKLALSTYHNIHQDPEKVGGDIGKLTKYLTDVSNKQKELDQREDELSNRIAILHRDLKEAEKQLETVRCKKDINAALRKDMERLKGRNYPQR